MVSSVFSLMMKSMTTFNKLIFVLITLLGITTNLMAEETASILQFPATAAIDRYQAVYRLNQEQRDQTIKPQCDINGTLCGKP